MDLSVKTAIANFLDQEALYDTVQVYSATLVDPPEYMDYCKLCKAQEREHNPSCLFYPLFMVA